MNTKILCSSVLISMNYFLEIEQRLFKPLGDNHQANAIDQLKFTIDTLNRSFI